MEWLTIKNLQAVPLENIPVSDIRGLGNDMIGRVKAGLRLVQFFAAPVAQHTLFFAVLADDEHSLLYLAAANLDGVTSYPALTPDLPSAHLFEREIFEQTGICPHGHPWLKPLRTGIAGVNTNETAYPFFRMDGEEVHEVAVGPIHAGVIEAGHFRFSCTGETVQHLEIQTGFQHRGVEHLFIKHPNLIFQTKLAESISGDTVVGHGTSFVNAVEALSGRQISRRAEQIRAIALELERVGAHLGDLSALSGDVAYLTGHAVFSALRTTVINTSMLICGSRFGRNLLRPGGVNYDIAPELVARILDAVDEWEAKTTLAAKVLFDSPSVLARFERTGVGSPTMARELGMVGFAARASGLSLDVRADFPYGAYNSFPVHAFSLTNGDVFSRAYLRYVEVIQSLRIIREQVETLQEGALHIPVGNCQAGHLVVSLCEGWRGEIAHVALTGDDGQFIHYKIKDPSFHNWFALAQVVRNEGISDFPLCNKSFNLSYCAVDL